MKWFDFYSWQFNLFPPLTWKVTSNSSTMLTAVLVLLISSACYLFISAFILNKIKIKQKTILSFLSLGYFLSAFYLFSEIAQVTIGPLFAPFSLLLKLILFQMVLIILHYGNWLVLIKTLEHQVKAIDYVRASHWLSLLMYSSFIIPLILFDMPMADSKSHTVYIGTLLLAIVLYRYLLFFIFKKSLFFFKLELPINSLPKKLKDKIEIASQPITESGNCSLFIVRSGFLNAVAFSPYNTIVIGLDLIRHLTTEELQAVLLHELGHLEDKKYIPIIRKVIVVFVALYLIYRVVVQADLFSPFTELLLFFSGLWIGAILIRKLRLRAEFVADSFVKDFSSDLHNHLVTGIERIVSLNGVDKNYCKRHNVGHLDLDERKQMVAKGKFGISRRPMRAFFTVFVPTIILIIGIQVGYSYLIPNDVKQWRKMHDRYHDLKSDKLYQEAEKTIQKALHFSKDKFGTNHHRTYICFNDLTLISLSLHNLPKAEEYALSAVEIGTVIYKGNNIKQTRSLENLARVRRQQERWGDVEKLYEDIFQIQISLNDDFYNISETIHSLIDLYTDQNEGTKALAMVNKLLEAYENQASGTEDSYLVHQLLFVRYNKLMIDAPDLTGKYLHDVAQLIEKKHGRVSPEYASYLSEYSSYLLENNLKDDAKKAILECVEIYDANGLEVDEEYAKCLHRLGVLAREERNYHQAENYLQLSLEIERELYRQEPIMLYSVLIELIELYKETGNADKTLEYYRLLISIEEDSQETEDDDLLYYYKELLPLLGSQSDSYEIKSIKEKIHKIESKSSS